MNKTLKQLLENKVRAEKKIKELEPLRDSLKVKISHLEIELDNIESVIEEQEDILKLEHHELFMAVSELLEKATDDEIQKFCDTHTTANWNIAKEIFEDNAKFIILDFFANEELRMMFLKKIDIDNNPKLTPIEGNWLYKGEKLSKILYRRPNETKQK